ncbi:N-acetylneuraminate synthase family protein [Alkalimarinus coralli]|uniref:N-acetylneuraminate synthase family protein n=1 Tax=Alkalimarinus coralli TaxID=2935863 RepID=UPI00202B3D3C|nr:N-acetylneuraminate synthase family protein [Alkalimarinus coralli]
MTYIIAEIGQAHDGSLGILHSYIDAVADTGVDAIKFQTHIAEAESSPLEGFRINFSYEDKTRFDYWKRMSFNFAQWQEIKAHCDSVGIDFLSTPFSNQAVDWLASLDMKMFKVGSGDVSNYLMLDKIGKTGKPIILSSGLSSLEDIEGSLNFLSRYGNEVAVLQCTTKYPTAFEDVGLNVMTDIRKRFSVKTGLSDHSGSIFPALAAASLGADVIEVHTVFDRRMFGPDSSSSLTLDELRELVKGIRAIGKMLSATIDKSKPQLDPNLKTLFGKTLCINKNKNAGSIISVDDLDGKKPAGQGVTVTEFEKVVGKKLTRGIQQWEFIQEADYE